MQNIFSTQDYASLYKDDRECLFSFSYQEDQYIFKNLAIKSLIPNTDLYDMSSPYGYSGYFTNTDNRVFLERALFEQKKKALNENIIAEFIRFHPCLNYAQSFRELLDFFALDKKIVLVKLNSFDRWKGYSSKMRNQIRQSQKNYTISLSQDYKKMYTIYTEAMHNKNASDFYFFSEEYFKKLLELDNCFMLESKLYGHTCAMAIFLYDNTAAYYHLSATTPYDKEDSIGSMRGILEQAFCILEEKQISFCILGGGFSREENDPLLNFKKKFSNILTPFYIGGKIYNQEKYQELSAKCFNNFFLKYRYN